MIGLVIDDVLSRLPDACRRAQIFIVEHVTQSFSPGKYLIAKDDCLFMAIKHARRLKILIEPTNQNKGE